MTFTLPVIVAFTEGIAAILAVATESEFRNTLSPVAKVQEIIVNVLLIAREEPLFTFAPALLFNSN